LFAASELAVEYHETIAPLRVIGGTVIEYG
jgi:hypothetical protein